MKKTKLICICIVLCLCCGCTGYKLERNYNYAPTIEFYMHPNDEGMAGYRCVYNENTNTLEAVNKKNIRCGAYGSFLVDSPEVEKIDALGLGQLNDYFYIDQTEFFLYWNWSENKQNTLVINRKGQIRQYSLTRGDALYYLNYANGVLHLAEPREWEKNDTLKERIISVNVASGEVQQHALVLYNSEIEKHFQVNKALHFSVEQWTRTTDSVVSRTTSNSNIVCTGMNYHISTKDEFIEEICYWLQKINPETQKVEKMQVINNEFSIEIFETKVGFGVVSYSAYDDKEQGKEPVKDIFITYFDENFEVLDKITLDSTAFSGCQSVSAGYYQGQLFLIGQSRAKKDVTVAVYNEKTGTIKVAENKIKGLIDDFHIVQKKNGKIEHLQIR